MIDNSNTFLAIQLRLCELLNSPTTPHQFNKLSTVLEISDYNSNKSSCYLKVQRKAA